MNALAHYYAAAASAFHEIFYHKLPENFSRNYSGKIPLFFRKFPEKFRTPNPICVCMYVRGSVIAKIIGHNVIEHHIFVQHVPLWVNEELFNGKKITEILNTRHENIKYLPGCIIPFNVVCTLCHRLMSQLFFSVLQCCWLGHRRNLEN